MNPIRKIRKFNFDNSINLNLNSVIVEEGIRRLRATWSPELAQDLQAYHGIDVTAELTRLLSEELAVDIGIQQTLNTVNNGLQDLLAIQPLGQPIGQIFYFDFQYDDSQKPTVYGDGSWSLGNTFESILGIKTEIKTHTFI
jgi:hypothetical protein